MSHTRTLLAALTTAVCWSSSVLAAVPSGLPTTPPASVEFDTIQRSDSGGSSVPDSAIAAGPSHVVCVANGRIQVRNKGGSLVSSQTLEGFYPGDDTGLVFDPRAAFDPQTNRFYVVAVGRNEDTHNAKCSLAVSKTADPTDGWHKYTWGASRTLGNNKWTFGDGATLGWGRDAIYIYVKCIQPDDEGGLTLGNRLFTIPKTKALNGTMNSTLRNSSQPNGDIITLSEIMLPGTTSLVGYLRPAETLSRTYPADPTPHADYFMAVMGGAGSSADSGLAVWTLVDPLGTRDWAGYHLRPTGCDGGNAYCTFSQDEYERQKGSSTYRLSTGSKDLGKTTYRDGALWTSHTLAQGGNAALPSQVRVYQLNANVALGTAPTVVKSHRLVADFMNPNETLAYFHSSFTTDPHGNGLVVFHASSTDIYPSIYAARYDASRQAFDTPRKLQEGTAPYKNTFDSRDLGDVIEVRWGDYTAVSADPDGESIWFQGEVTTSEQDWKLRAGRVPTTPAAPYNFYATVASDNKVTLNWNYDDALADGFVIERAQGSNAYVALNTSTLTKASRTFVDTTAAGGMQYKYRIGAYKGTTTRPSIAQVDVSTGTPEGLGGNPYGYVNQSSPTTINGVTYIKHRIVWTDKIGYESGYRVYSSIYPLTAPWQLMGEVTRNTEMLEITRPVGELWWYRVVSFTGKGESAPSDPFPVQAIP